MTTRRLANRLGLTLCAIFLAQPLLRAQTVTYTTLDAPSSTSTQATSISGNNVAGSYIDSGGLSHGFFYTGGNFTTIDPPGSNGTQGSGVSGTNVVGSYVDSSSVQHGFFFDGTNYTTLDPTGTTGTQANAVDGTNVAGTYLDASSVNHGFLFDGTNYTTLDPPGSTGTQANGISGSNIVGTYFDSSNVQHGFLYNGITYTTLDPPGSTLTVANGVSGNNVVGIYTDSSSVVHGFFYNGSTFTTIDPSGTTNTDALGVSGNNIAGKYVDGSSVVHGFYFDGTNYTTIDPPSSTQTIAAAVSGNNVVGSYNGLHGFLATIKTSATVTLNVDSLTATYNGSPQPVTATTTPPGLEVDFTYTDSNNNTSSTAPTNAGSYTVVGTVNNPNYTGSATGTLVIYKATATGTINSASLSATYDGNPHAATAMTNPPGLEVDFTYTDSNNITSSTAPTNAGSYTVTATINDPNYMGGGTGTLVIAQAAANVTLNNGSLSATYDGTPHAATATTVPSGLAVNFTYTDSNNVVSATAPTSAGTYTVNATINDPNYTGSTSGMLVISPATASVTVNNLTFNYDGTPHAATASTTPIGLEVTFTYKDASNNVSSTPPTDAGTYTVTGTVSDPNYSGSGMGTLVINPIAAMVTVNDLTFTYDGTPKSATASTTPTGLAVSFTYNGSATAPTAAGNYTVVGTISDPNYTGSGSGTLFIGKATATITLGSLTASYNGSPQAATATTNPSGLTVTFTYNGSATAPTAIGSYTVVGTIVDPNYQGTQSGTLVIGPAKKAATITLGGLATTYNGKAHSATAATNPASLPVTFTYNGSSTAPTNAGSYTVVATVNSSTYQGSATGTLVIGKAPATATLSGLTSVYNGSAKSATATTKPTGLDVTFTYNGSATAPTNAGSYPVVATISDPNYTGTAKGTLVISKAAATAVLGNLSTTYTGSPQSATATTNPSGLTVDFTYSGSATAPTNAGSYPVVGTITDPNYVGSAKGTFVIGKAAATVAVGTISAYYTGSGVPATATTTPAGLPVTFTYAGKSTLPVNLGTYAVVGTINSPNYTGTGSGSLTISIAPIMAYVGASGAEVTDGVDPNGVSTKVYFEYGTTTAYSSTPTAMQSIGNGKVPVNIYALFPGLLPNTVYHYRLVTVTAAGTVYGPDETFTTLGFDTQLVAASKSTPVNIPGSSPAANTTFASFGNPAVNMDDTVAFEGTLTLATGVTTANDIGIWTIDNTNTQTLVAQIGNVAPGTTADFLTLGDPVLNNNGAVAFYATLKVATGAATKTTASGIWSTGTGSLQLVARQGSAAPGTTGTFETFTSLAFTDSGDVLFLATLNAGTGITSANNMGVWEGTSAGNLALMLRLGQVVDGKTIAKLSFLPVEKIVNGQTRNFNSTNGDFICDATFSDGTNGVIEVYGGTPQISIGTGVSAGNWFPNATFASFSNPVMNVNDFNGFISTLTTGLGGVTASNNLAIFDDDSFGGGELIARTGTGSAPGTTATFAAFTDPIYNDNEVMAFQATLTVGSGQATATTNSGIWCDSGEPLTLIAQTGVTPAPGCPAGATFSAFNELVLPNQGGSTNQGGVIFLATLNTNAAAGVTSSNNLGIWAVDNTGTLQLVVRTGDIVNNKTVTGIAFLPAETIVNSQSRSFAQANGDLVYLATFSDKSTAIINVVF